MITLANGDRMETVRVNVRAAARAGFPELTLEHSEWQRLVDSGETDVIIQGPGVKMKTWTAKLYMQMAMAALSDVPEPLAGVLLHAAISDQ